MKRQRTSSGDAHRREAQNNRQPQVKSSGLRGGYWEEKFIREMMACRSVLGETYVNDWWLQNGSPELSPMGAYFRLSALQTKRLEKQHAK